MTTATQAMRDRLGEATTPSTLPELPAAAARVLGRRTLRRYTTRPISPALMDLLLACAQSGPTKSNLQQYSILVVEDPAKQAALAELVPSMPWIAEATGLLVFLGDLRRNRRIAELRGHPYRNNSADSFMNAAVDAAIAMQTLILTAESLGLGCCPISVLRNHLTKLRTLFDLPSGVFPIAGLTLGWPSDPGRLSLRLPARAVVHRDRYDDSGFEEAIEAYDAEAHRRHPIGPDKQRHTALYGTLETCTWSENVARQLSQPERADFSDFLREQEIALD